MFKLPAFQNKAQYFGKDSKNPTTGQYRQVKHPVKITGHVEKLDMWFKTKRKISY